MKSDTKLTLIMMAVIMFSSLSHAAVTINVNEVTGDVVASLSGTIDTTGFDSQSGLTDTQGAIVGTGFNADWNCYVRAGTSLGNIGAYIIADFTNHNVDVCSTGGLFSASSGSGDMVGVASRIANTDVIYVPSGYVSGTPLSGTSTWPGESFTSMSLIPGTYVFTWGTGATVDSLTINIGEPEPGSTYSVGGTVSGLTGAGLALQNNGADTLAVAADGPFTFLTKLADSSVYRVTVSTQPAGQTCTVSSESGIIASAEVTDVSVVCVDDVIPPIEPPEPATPVPTLSQWASILFSILIGWMVYANRRRLF